MNERRAFFSRLEIIFHFFMFSIRFFFYSSQALKSTIATRCLVRCLAVRIPSILYLFTCAPAHLFNGCTLSSDKHTNESEYAERFEMNVSATQNLSLYRDRDNI